MDSAPVASLPVASLAAMFSELASQCSAVQAGRAVVAPSCAPQGALC